MKKYFSSGKAVLVIVVLLAVLLSGCSTSTTTSSTTASSTTQPVTTTPPTTTTATSTTATSLPPTTTLPSITTATTTATPTQPSAGPAIRITEPGSGNKFGIGNLTVTVEVSNFTIVNQLGKSNSAGQGHIHYFMDVDAPTATGQPAVSAAGTYAALADTSFTWTNVGGGSHTFSVELVNNDHTPLNPPVIDSKTVLVIPEIGPPGMVILTPRDNSIVKAGDVTIAVQATNFNLVDKLSQPNVQREGHLHYFLDVEAPTTAGQAAVTAAGTYAATSADSYTWKNVTPGMHTFSVELINNDHTPLSPAVVSKIMVNVAGTQPSVPTSSTPSLTTPTTAAGGQSITINLIAKSMAFDKSTLSVRAGANVTIVFDNQDAGIPHNVSVYQNMTDGSTKTVFIGDVITGPSKITYQFVAPKTPGDYYFVCDIHPQIMKGPFLVTP
jgi:plastocyanin